MRHAIGAMTRLTVATGRRIMREATRRIAGVVSGWRRFMPGKKDLMKPKGDTKKKAAAKKKKATSGSKPDTRYGRPF